MVLKLLNVVDFVSLTNLQISKIAERLEPKYKNRFKVVLVPNITNICYGRGVGYKVEELVLPQNIEKISATKIRKEMSQKKKLK